MRRFVAYLRVSTNQQGIDGLGVEAQRRSIESYTSSRGELVGLYTEVESGRKRRRPELAKALTACKVKRATLVVAKLDRLARNVALIATLMESDVEFIAADYPEAGRLTMHILAVVAEHEQIAISQRTRQALAAAKARGVRLGNPAFGADGGSSSRKGVVVRQDQAAQRARELAPVVKEIRSAGVSTYAGIARALNARGIPAARGGYWHASSARDLVLRINVTSQ